MGESARFVSVQPQMHHFNLISQQNRNSSNRRYHAVVMSASSILVGCKDIAVAGVCSDQPRSSAGSKNWQPMERFQSCTYVHTYIRADNAPHGNPMSRTAQS